MWLTIVVRGLSLLSGVWWPEFRCCIILTIVVFGCPRRNCGIELVIGRVTIIVSLPHSSFHLATKLITVTYNNCTHKAWYGTAALKLVFGKFTIVVSYNIFVSLEVYNSDCRPYYPTCTKLYVKEAADWRHAIPCHFYHQFRV